MAELSYANNQELSEIRCDNIGSSESPALGGVTTWASPFSIYHAKKLRTPMDAPENDRMEAGKRLESAIAAWAADKGGFRLVKSQVYVTSDVVPKMGSTTDYFIEDPRRGDWGLLEVKNRDWLQWKQHWTDKKPPADTAWQVQHQLACTGFKWAVIACLVGGNDLKLYQMAPVERAMTHIGELVTEFWAGFDAGLEPPVEGYPCDLETLNDLYATVERGEVKLVDDAELAETIRMFDWARDEAGERKKTADSCKAKILQVLGNAEILIAPTVQVRQSIDSRGARRLKVETDRPDHRSSPTSVLEAG